MKASGRVRNKETIHYHFMLFPSIVILAIFSIYPTLGSIMAFKYFDPIAGIWGSPWAGLDHFKMLFQIPEFKQITINTITISVVKIILNVSCALAFALLLHEIKRRWFKRSVQTIVYLPFFLSWVIMAGIFKDFFSIDGMVNGVVHKLTGGEPVMFFNSNVWFMIIVYVTDVWKGFGFNAIVFLAALTSINPNLYEAADVDGASRWAKLRNITLPSIKGTVVLILILSLQGILSGGFDQIFNLYNPLVYQVADIYDTYIYRMGFQSNQYEFATAVGLFRSAVAFIFILISQWLAEKYGEYKVF
ncbi:putative aldouronate transport system permease protein [Paenibacillus taihuensis]|uniref:Putative aldouronate transport system permease protein n=1 Tax=Paenibacillus taihuensis TaxID=1156355 RepID=A0A3D9RNX4_9BACL|nr:ABC transporter permease subunit [Paenibacillus taihuensis]REE81507.1 putative aldouronate transport system permease protein [Paenibacillus taihuensis]